MNEFMDGKRQKISQENYGVRGTGEAYATTPVGHQPPVVPHEETTKEEDIFKRILEKKNLRSSLKRVKENKGAPGVDSMKTEELKEKDKAAHQAKWRNLC
ncbi:MAG: hypothetical protein ACYC56_05985 [Candidatus Aquicultor sp.]